MKILKGLSSAARTALSDEFRRGLVPAVDVAEYEEAHDFNRVIDLEPLREVVEIAMKQPDRRTSDAWLGPRVHAALRLTRREAADRRIWQYLSIAEFPEYVHWRWKQDDEERPIPYERFVGGEKHNAFGNLWWVSELTRNGNDYKTAETANSISRFSVSWLTLNAMHHRPCALAVVDFLNDLRTAGPNDEQSQKMVKAFNAVLRTTSLDAFVPNHPTDSDAVRDWIAETIDVTTMVDHLPIGPDEAPVHQDAIDIVRKFLDDLAVRIGIVTKKH